MTITIIPSKYKSFTIDSRDVNIKEFCKFLDLPQKAINAIVVGTNVKNIEISVLVGGSWVEIR